MHCVVFYENINCHREMEVLSWNLEVAEADVLAEITGGEVRVWCLLLFRFLPLHSQQWWRNSRSLLKIINFTSLSAYRLYILH